MIIIVVIQCSTGGTLPILLRCCSNVTVVALAVLNLISLFDLRTKKKLNNIGKDMSLLVRNMDCKMKAIVTL